MTCGGWVRIFAVGVVLLSAVAVPSPATAASARPDLVQTSLSHPPAAVAAGLRFTVRDTVKNRGARVARKSKTGHYLSLDRAWSKRDIALGARKVPRLPAGARSSGERLVRVPASTPLKRFYVLACADHKKVVRESTEGNNCRASAARVRVRAPSCQEELGLRGVSFTPGSSQPGVDDPVTVSTPIEGVTFTRSGSAQTSLFVDCSLAVRLHTVSEGLAVQGIDSVEHLGTYNYRCIGGGVPGPDPDNPGCTLSDHAFGTAIDFASFSGDGATYDVEADWEADLNADTCTDPTANEKHEFLRDLACGWYDAGLFNIILTPNYNASHANHIHVDLTPGASFID